MEDSDGVGREGGLHENGANCNVEKADTNRRGVFFSLFLNVSRFLNLFL